MYLLDRRYSELPLDRMIVVADETGLRSFPAASYLARNGLKSVTRLQGGMDRWKDVLRKGQMK